jgi:hypothetical protein
MQVFEPERQEFDFILNRKILARLGIRFWRLVSLAPVMRDPAAMASIIKDLSNASVLTPEECRELAGDVFNREFRHLDASWTKQPSALTVAGIPVEPEKPFGEPTGPREPTDDQDWKPGGGEVAPDRPEGEGIEARLKKKFNGVRLSEVKKLLAIRRALRLAEHDVWLDKLQAAHEAESAAE